MFLLHKCAVCVCVCVCVCVWGGGGGSDKMENVFRMIKGQGHVFDIKVSVLKFHKSREKTYFPYLRDMDFSVFERLLWGFFEVRNQL